ncbi:NADH dehydrogenase-like protein [Leptotrombidium deliense]|uniref:NADH dehydrogenase-like protein n=1 Tax=Leptotrombidium deliense TaxID=299467 RepID=A0A443S512_9ACAR|nr:NADH dehydrogenase-like protein [Leptotrombidium deliense]
MVSKWIQSYSLFPTFYWETRIPTKEDQKGLCLPKGTRIPDWQSYKVSEFTPELQALEKRLAAKGLKDPWIRNEVWRFDTRIWGNNWQRRFQFLRGSGCALLVTAAIVLVKETFFKESDHHHGHEDKYPLLKELNAPKLSHH